jgi:hypothetical protein
MSEQNVRIEEIKVRGSKLFEKGKMVVHAGNIRRLIIKNKAGRALLDIPLTIGVIGAVLAPQLALIGAVIALFIDGSIVVEKITEANEEAVEDMFEI